MRTASLIFLFALAAQAAVQGSIVTPVDRSLSRPAVQDAMSLIDNLFTRALKVSFISSAHLENSTLGKEAASASRASTSVRSMNQLPRTVMREFGIAGQSTLGKQVASASRVSTSVRSMNQLDRTVMREFGITGQSVANGKYLLCDRPKISASGQATIYEAYEAGPNGLPKGEKLAIKISNDCESLALENKNYDRIKDWTLFPGRFIRKIEYLPDLNSEISFNNKCGLVIEAGRTDLEALLKERRQNGLEGRALRDAAAAAAQCIQAIHSSGLVWSDIKAPNFVVVGDEIGDSGSLPGVKGIDVESCRPRGSACARFSPEGCPPELARSIIRGTSDEFKLEYSYDIFGYGLLLYELAMGVPLFGKMRSDSRIIGQFGVDNFEADVSRIEDGKLRDLIQQCLRGDPKKRPNILQVLLHPYFITTGVGRFGFPDR